jgi:alpha-beta hydrolase superfamily lysophospholipase
MIEMLNPSLADAGRFARELLAFRVAYAAKTQTEATEMAVQRFCTPTGRRNYPSLKDLESDAWRYGKTRLAGAQHIDAQAIQQILSGAKQHSIQLKCGGQTEQIVTYTWQPRPLQRGKDCAPRALLVHGWEGYALNFALITHYLLEAGFEVMSFDHIAHGASSGQTAGLPKFADGLRAVNHHFGMDERNWDLALGHSLGGGAVLYSAAYQGLQAKRIGLLAPFIDTPALLRRWAQLHGLGGKAAELMEREIERQSVIPGMRMTDFLPEALAQGIRSEILIAHDPKDIVVPIATSQAFAQLHKRTTLRPSPKLGHVGVLFDTKLCEELVTWSSP